MASSQPPPKARPFSAAITGLLRVPELGQPGKAARAVIGLPPAADEIVPVGGLQIPAGGENAVAGAGDDAAPKLRIVAQGDEGLTEGTAGRDVDRIGLGPVQGHFQHMPATHHLHGFTHRPLPDDPHSSGLARSSATMHRTADMRKGDIGMARSDLAASGADCTP